MSIDRFNARMSSGFEDAAYEREDSGYSFQYSVQLEQSGATFCQLFDVKPKM